MVNKGGICLYKEARLNIEPAFPGSTVAFTLPASSTSTFGLRTHSKRTVIADNYTVQDDDTFTRRHLASDGSMFFRRHHEYPRSFLWRMLDGRKLLEIQSVDVDHDLSHCFEANLTLLFQFTSPVRPFCVAFAEPEDRDALTIVAITTANELYTITLHRDFFVKLSASEQNIGDWCKRSSVTLFQTHVPYRLVAVSVNELLVSLHNGGILRLTRSSRDDVVWTEALYQQNSWSVRGLLSWKGQQTVRYDNTELELSAAAAIALSVDGKHIFSVSLDHKLRAWNVKTGKPGVQMDLLGELERLNEKTASYFIGPSQSALMTIIDMPGGIEGATYFVVTYSPKQHQFKFWGIRDADDPDLGIYDAQPDVGLIPPVDEMMDATVWTMEEFIIIPGPAGWRGTVLWIRARSGPSSKVYSLKFDLNEEPGKLAQTWKNDWISVDSGPLTVDGLKKNPTNPSELDHDDSEACDLSLPNQWLDFLFYPGRFTVPTLETALVIYQKGLDRTHTIYRGSLKERICATISAFTSKGQDGTVDVDLHEDAVASQWQAFYGLVKDLHKRRGESLSLTYDHGLDMPWLVLSDYFSAIRKCSEAEIGTLNSGPISRSRQPVGQLRKVFAKPEARDVAMLLNATASFRKRLPMSFQSEIQHQVELDLLQSRSLTVVDRMELMEQNCELLQLLSEEDLSLLVEELGTDIKHLNTDTFLRAIQTLGFEEQGRVNRKQITRYGLSALSRVSQETLDGNYNILLDLLVLILFMQYEDDISEDFDASEVFVELVDQFKDCITLTWMASTVWSHQTPTSPSSEGMLKALSETYKSSSRFPITQTVLEGIRGHRSFEIPIPRGLKTDLFTYWSRAWLASVFREQNYDAAVEDTMGILLSQKEYELALEFSKFLPEGNWATYLKGRMYIALSENTLASICFQKVAYNLALGLFNVEDADTAALVSETERNSFSEGLPRYYHHVLGLFEKVKAYTFVAEFARLGLRTLKGREDEELRTDLLQRLFTASIQTSNFQEAYSAMIQHSDVALKHSSLQTLITSMIQQGQASSVLKFPFVGLLDEVDMILSSLCHKTLNLASGPPYHQILYSFRISRNNFRGAASILYDRLQRLKTTSSKIHDPADESLVQCYLMIINTLSSVNTEDAYILAEQRIDDGAPPHWGIGKAKKMLKRQIITLSTLRKEYQAELDRVAAIESGQFPFVQAADEMDIL